MKSYIDSLPKDHLNNLYGKSIQVLSRGENVLISAIHGCGINIFLNLFSKLIREENIFKHIYLYDPSVEEDDIIKFVKKIKKSSNERNLVIIKSFEKLTDKVDILEKIHALRQPSPFNLVFIVFTDHT